MQIIIYVDSELDAKGYTLKNPADMATVKEVIEAWIQDELDHHLYDMLDQADIEFTHEE